jgi:hypothetical protein
MVRKTKFCGNKELICNAPIAKKCPYGYTSRFCWHFTDWIIVEGYCRWKLSGGNLYKFIRPTVTR